MSKKCIPFDFAMTEIPEGLSIVEASAGTGKTFAISHCVPRFLVDGMVDRLSEILLVTFTNDAARELAERVRSVLAELDSLPTPDEQQKNPGMAELRRRLAASSEARQRLRRAYLDSDQLQVSTIHSFCQRTLQMEGTLCGLASMPELITDDRDYVEETLQDLWHTQIASDPFLAAVAKANDWKAQKDASVIRAARNLSSAQWQPQPAVFSGQLKRLRKILARLKDEKAAKGFATQIASVPKWNGNHSAESCMQELQQIHAINPDSPSSVDLTTVCKWQKFPERINRRLAEGKAAAAALEENELIIACKEFAELCASLVWSWQHHCFKEVELRVSDALTRNRQITQNGLIQTLHAALVSHEHGPQLASRLANRYRIALIDESQDTDPLQFEIFKRVFVDTALPGHRLMMIGDPKQAIYGFRGADLETYLRARNQGQARFSLNQTYRSPQKLVAAVNTLFSPTHAFLHDELAFSPASSGKTEDLVLVGEEGRDKPRITAWIIPVEEGSYFKKSYQRKKRISDITAAEIVRLLESGQIQERKNRCVTLSRKVLPGDIAILVYSNQEGSLMAQTLRSRGVPAVVTSGQDVMSTDEAQELLRLLRAINEPRRSELRRAALATRLLGWDSDALQQLETDVAAEEAVLRDFEHWNTLWHQYGIAGLLLHIDKDKNLTMRLAKTPQGERRVMNLRHLSDLLQQEATERRGNPERLLRWLVKECARAAETQAIEERQLQLESDAQAVQIVTMHKAKGLEYNLVFCPYLWSNREPKGVGSLRAKTSDRRDMLIDIQFAKKGQPELYALLVRNQMEERLRLAYVALTRAKVGLWIWGGEMGASIWMGRLPASALDWLLRGDDVSTENLVSWAEKEACSQRGNRHTKRLTELFGKESDLLQIVTPPHPDTRSWISEGQPANRLEAQQPPNIPMPWVLTSFSGLTADKHEHGAIVRINSEDSSDTKEEMGANRFLHAPGGASVGTAIHDFLESWDFKAVERGALNELARRIFRNGSQDTQKEQVSMLSSMISHLRDAVLPGPGTKIGELCSDPQASEWHFFMQLRPGFHVKKIADIFHKHADPSHRAYAPMLEMISAETIDGYLHGFIDRMVASPDGWGVIDWKTNLLGPQPADYSEERLSECAMNSHYLLQAHLYLVALRRYLLVRGEETSKLRAWFVFLRAVEAGTAKGILELEPSEEMLTALDQLFWSPEEQ